MSTLSKNESKKADKAIEIKDFNLTGRERDILTILWKAGKGMIASEIVGTNGNLPDDGDAKALTINTVQAVLKKLLRRNLIKVDQIVYSGTVLSRSYVPTISEEEFMKQKISYEIQQLKKFDITPGMFIVGFLGNSKVKITDDEAEMLEALIKTKKG